jgi:hypothetical protein
VWLGPIWNHYETADMKADFNNPCMGEQPFAWPITKQDSPSCTLDLAATEWP